MYSQAGTAFTTWLDFNQASMQAKAILSALEKLRPEHTAIFRQNFVPLQSELDGLDKSINNIVAHHTDTLLVASHPVYQYLARCYKLKLKSVMREPGVVPDQSQWHELQQLLKTHEARWMIWEGQPGIQSCCKCTGTG